MTEKEGEVLEIKEPYYTRDALVEQRDCSITFRAQKTLIISAKEHRRETVLNGYVIQTLCATEKTQRRL